jgi:spermidine/putrescine transport system ATP-binding protein
MESSHTAGSGQGSVSLKGVTKRFGNFTAVDDLDLDLRSGEFFTLLGPSGCGKTTTLRMIAGFETPDAGQVLIDGSDVAAMPPHKRPTNTVFQSYALFPHMSVRDNVAYGLKRRGTDKGEVDRRVQAELERVGLWGEANRRPNQLSGGQQQRVALARAVVNLPKVLLLDEPLGALDLKLRKNLQVELKRIQKEIGITFVYVTHDQEEALTMSDRIAVMNRGIVEQVAGPEEVYERPTTTFVAGFIGVSNLMPGTVRSLNGGRATVELEAGVTVEADGHSLGTGERCHAVVRPEKLVVSVAGNGSRPDSSTQQSVDGVVASSVYLGTATQLVVELKGGSRMTVLVPNASESQRQQLPGGGAQVHLAWTPEHIHLVRESGAERATADHEALGKERQAVSG